MWPVKGIGFGEGGGRLESKKLFRFTGAQDVLHELCLRLNIIHSVQGPKDSASWTDTQNVCPWQNLELHNTIGVAHQTGQCEAGGPGIQSSVAGLTLRSHIGLEQPEIQLRLVFELEYFTHRIKSRILNRMGFFLFLNFMNMWWRNRVRDKCS